MHVLGQAEEFLSAFRVLVRCHIWLPHRVAASSDPAAWDAYWVIKLSPSNSHTPTQRRERRPSVAPSSR